jgi:hypothetical protein
MNTRRKKMPKPMPRYENGTKVRIANVDDSYDNGVVVNWYPKKFCEDGYDIKWDGGLITPDVPESRVSKYVLLYRAYERKLKLNAKKEKRDNEESRG